MAKRGERRPWKVIAQWPGDRPFTRSFQTQHDAEWAAQLQRATVSGTTGEADCSARVVYRP